jgi:peptidoglycan-associated lipoprotein
MARFARNSQALFRPLSTFVQIYLLSSSCLRQPPFGTPAMQLDPRSATLTRLAALGAALALAACASKPIAPPAPAPVAASAPAPVAAAPAPVAAPAPAPLAAYLDPNNPISQQRSVYFAFDDAAFRAQDKSVIELQGRYLAQHPELHVTVAGNTDERGGSEYNLALGQRRAQSVKTALGVLGVKDSQVEAISYGKEKPKATGHDEAAWEQNRRADIVYPAS